jgi:hypothetical protein
VKAQRTHKEHKEEDFLGKKEEKKNNSQISTHSGLKTQRFLGRISCLSFPSYSFFVPFVPLWLILDLILSRIGKGRAANWGLDSAQKPPINYLHLISIYPIIIHSES